MKMKNLSDPEYNCRGNTFRKDCKWSWLTWQREVVEEVGDKRGGGWRTGGNGGAEGAAGRDCVIINCLHGTHLKVLHLLSNEISIQQVPLCIYLGHPVLHSVLASNVMCVILWFTPDDIQLRNNWEGTSFRLVVSTSCGGDINKSSIERLFISNFLKFL